MYNPRMIDSVHATTIEELANGAIAKNDFVTLKTDGQIEATATGNPIFGIAINSATTANDKVLVQRAYKGMRVLIDCDQVGTTLADTSKGGRVDITGSTGAQVVDSSTVLKVGDGTDTGQLLIVDMNPQGYGFDSDTSIALCEIAEVQ